MNMLLCTAAFWWLFFSLPQPAAPPTAIKVFTTRAIKTVLDETAPEFEKMTGYRLDVKTDIAIRMVRGIQAGMPFDVLVASPNQIDTLIRQGKINGETRTMLARSGIGVAVRAGAVKPEMGSVEAFKSALLKARSIAYLKEGQSGIYLAGLMDSLGLAEALRYKVIRPEQDVVSELVAKGEVELGLVVITQIVTTPGVELAGPLPPEIQSHVVFATGVSSRAAAPDGARELIRFLTAPRAAAVMKLQGMQPWTE